MGKLYENSKSFVNEWNEPCISIENNKKVSVVIPVYHQKYLPCFLSLKEIK